MRLLIENAGLIAGIVRDGRERLQGSEMGQAEQIEGGYLVCDDGLIADFGPMSELPAGHFAHRIDAAGGALLPAFCDSHSHIVFAGWREGEFRDKIGGLSYEQVAARGGGILNSVDRLHLTTEDELFEQALPRAIELMRSGAATIEIKSGYGLSTPDELKMLRVIARLRERLPITIKATFLGAHAVARGVSQTDYVDTVVGEMIPAVAAEGLAEFVDVFCDRGYFTPTETARILECGLRYGLRPKIHANELASSGGVQVGVRHNALSVDHLEQANDDDIDCLLGSKTMPTLLPGASFFSNLPYAPARKMIDAGLGVALASDYNPGSSPSGNMMFLWSLATIKMRMTPEEALSALTLNGAYALCLGRDRGAITVGRRADLIITEPVGSLAFLPYSFGANRLKHLIVSGKEIDYEKL